MGSCPASATGSHARDRAALTAFILTLALPACSASQPYHRSIAEIQQMTLGDATEWLETNLCGDARCREGRPFRRLTGIEHVAMRDCQLEIGQSSAIPPARIPLGEVWEIVAPSNRLDQGFVQVRWWGSPASDVWYWELSDRVRLAWGDEEPGSAVVAFRVRGSDAGRDAALIRSVLQHAVNLCSYGAPTSQP